MITSSESQEPTAVQAAFRVIDQLEPEIRAFVHLGDRTVAPRADHGPLEDLPVGVKDLFRVAGMPTRVGSALPPELFAGAESAVVTRLRAAGATIVGKTAMDEFAYCEPPATKNPRDQRRTPGGSSGGSAAAVAAGMCSIAIGSQTLLSTIVPASYCGVVGFKPTFGRIPFDGVPLAPSLDTVGLLGTTVDVVRTAAQQLFPDWRTIAGPDQPVIGLPDRWGLARLHTDGWDAFDLHAQALAATGLETRSGRLPWNDDLDHWAAVIRDLVHGELARVHAGWFGDHVALYRPRTRRAIELGQAVDDRRLAACVGLRETLAELVQQATERAGADCWSCPSTGTVAPLGYDSTGDGWLTSFWSYLGWPSITLPIFDGPDGLPRGLQCVAPAGHDEELLAWAGSLSELLDESR